MNTIEQTKANEVFLQRIADLYVGDTEKPAFAPFSTLGKEMVDRLPSVAGSILVLSDAGLLVAVLRRLKAEGRDFSKVQFIAHTEQVHTFVRGLGVASRLVGYNQLQDWFKEAEMGLKFDVVVGNPPYKAGLHMDFFKVGALMLRPGGRLLFVHPSTDFIKQGQGRVDPTLQDVCKKLKSLRLVNAAVYFGKSIELGVPLAISEVDESHCGPIEFSIDDNTCLIQTLNEASVHYFKAGWQEFKPFALSKSEVDPISAHLLWSSNVGGASSYKISEHRFFLEGSGVIGHVADVTDDSRTLSAEGILKPDASVFLLEMNLKISEAKDLQGTKHKWVLGFKTEAEAKSALSYLKTKHARAFLSIFRYGTGLGRQHFSSVPAVPFNQEWDDTKCAEYFKTSNTCMEYINTIPKYYSFD